MNRVKFSENIINKFDYLYRKYSDYTCNTVGETVRLIGLIELELLSSEYCPEFILGYSFFNSSLEKTFDTIKLTIRPSIKYNLKCEEMKYSFVLVNNENIINDLINNLILWIADYNYYSYLDGNIQKLNDVVWDIMSNIEDVNWTMTFNIGDGILDISDNSIVLGVSDTNIINLDNIGLFSNDDYWRNLYIEKFKNTLKECNRPYDIVKSKSDFSMDLGIYNRKSISKLIRKFIKRRIECVRVGVGYLENSYNFALIEKKAISDKELEKCSFGDDYIVLDNNSPTVAEKKAGLNKILVVYRLMPFEKKTNEYLDIRLNEYLRESGVVLE